MPSIGRKQQVIESVATGEDYFKLRQRRVLMCASLQKDSTKEISKAGQEFRSMMSEFESFSNREIESLSNPRYRAIFRGVKAGALEPSVFRAFEVLYEDMVPVRLAGRMIHKRLKQLLAQSVERRLQEDENIVKATGLELEEIDDGRRAFMAIKANKDEYMTLDQLVNSGILHTIVELSELESFDKFVAQLQVDERGRLNFENFMIGLQQCAADSESPGCKISSVIQEVETRMGPIEARNNLVSIERRKQKYKEKFDNMLLAFELWEQKTIRGEGRMIDVLNGCFEGAKNEAIVDALRIVYLDYSALRVAGDLIFKLVSRLIG